MDVSLVYGGKMHIHQPSIKNYFKVARTSHYHATDSPVFMCKTCGKKIMLCKDAYIRFNWAIKMHRYAVFVLIFLLLSKWNWILFVSVAIFSLVYAAIEYYLYFYLCKKATFVEVELSKN